jgi:uncharacterized membrane protein (UPF0127 family)
MLRFAAAAALIFFAVSACARDAGAPEAPLTPTPEGAIELRHASGVLRVEVARTGEERATGLSNRTSLADDAGMLFVYETPRRPSFWMRQTLIPLDIVWIDAGKRVTQIHADVQPEPGVADGSLRRYVPDSDVLYALELNAGTAARLGIESGDTLQFDVTEP